MEAEDIKRLIKEVLMSDEFLEAFAEKFVLAPLLPTHED